ncbi:MAG: SLC13 family permease [Roseiflexaceae bacterium]
MLYQEYPFVLGLTLQQILFLVILVAAFALLLTERLRNDLVALLIILALAISGVLAPEEALSGFGSEAAIVVAAIFVLSGALHQTGLSDMLGNWIGRVAGRGEGRALAVIMPAVALLSAFTHHLTTTAVMLPVTLNLARERGIAASRLLMPLSFAASLGTTITIIGAPAFLIASATLEQAGRPGLGIFSIAPIGLTLTLAGTLFVLLVGRRLLPAHPDSADPADRFRLDDYFTELTVLPDSPLSDRTVEELEQDEHYTFRVVGLMRNGRRVRRPLALRRVSAGDVLLVRAPPEELVTIRQEAGVELHPVSKYGAANGGSGGEGEEIEDMLVQAVVAPNADLVGRTIAEVDFRRRFGVIVISLWRKQGWLHQELARIKLQAGDALVLQGDPESLARVASDPAFLMLVPFHGEARPRGKAALAAGIMLATVVLAASGLLSIEIAALAGAAAMLLTGCLRVRQAYRAIDTRIYVFIAGALPLGLAMQKSGTSTLLAGWLQQAVGGLSPTLILLALFALVAVLTQFMSDAATTAVFAPVALALAQALGHAPEPYVVTVAMAAVASFLTPIGHHGNLLVYGPGRYQFADFVRVGTPLTLIVGLIVVLLAQQLW